MKYTGRKDYNTSFFDTGERDADEGTNFVVGNLVPGTLYNFKVNGISVCGEGQPNTVDATTKMAGKQYQPQFNKSKMFRYSFSEIIPTFSIALKMILSLSGLYEIFPTDWLWTEVCQNVVLSNIEIIMTTINKKLWIDKSRILRDLELLLKRRHQELKVWQYN